MYELKLENVNGNVVNVNDGVKYTVISALGLNPPSASIFTAKSPNRKGVKYNGSTLNERNIVLQIKILGDIEANRNALYAWVDCEQYCKVSYKNEIKNVYCEGHIQECDIDLFTDNEIVNVAILCADPYWVTVHEESVSLTSIVKNFVFPFAINVAGIPFSTITRSAEVTINNEGAETGARFIIKCDGDIKNLTLYDGKDTTRRFVINAELLKNWIVVIDTDRSPKTVKAYKPDGTTENLLKYVNNPTWFTIKKGENVFGYTATSGADNADITISYQDKCLGV